MPLVSQVTRRDIVARGTNDRFVYRQGGATNANGTGGSPLHVPPISFAFGDAAAPVFTATVGCVLTQLSIVIDTPFNGVGAQIQLSVGATVIMPTNENDPAHAFEYQVAPALALNVGDQVTLTITPGAGATTGAGRIFIELQ